MKTSGAQSVPGGEAHGASCDAIVAGTSAVCTQWAPSPHAVSVETSTSGAPVYGHIGGGVLVVPPPPPPQPPPPPPLQSAGLPMSHAPDGMLLSGLTHGAQRSSAAHDVLRQERLVLLDLRNADAQADAVGAVERLAASAAPRRPT